jgi:hypothetical protein
MDNAIGIIITLLIFTPFVLILVWAFRYQKKVYAKGWELMIDRMSSNNANITSLLPQDRRVKLDMAGSWNGNNIDIVNEWIGQGRGRTMITRMIMTFPKKTLPDFVLSKENLLTRAGEKLGIKDIKTGDAEFDRVFRLTSEFDEQATLRFFDDQLIQKLKRDQKHFMGEMSSKNNTLSVVINSLPGYRTMQPFFKTTFDLLIFTAGKRVN